MQSVIKDWICRANLMNEAKGNITDRVFRIVRGIGNGKCQSVSVSREKGNN